MLCAKRKFTGEIITAYFTTKAHGPFVCSDCGDEVILKSGRQTVNHFAHVNPLACRYAEGESDGHRRCKMEIFLALQKEPHVRNVMLERPLGTNRPDVSAEINGVPVAIEVQLSSLSIETIMQRGPLTISAKAFMSSGFCRGRQNSMPSATPRACGKSGFMPHILAGCITGPEDFQSSATISIHI